MNAGPLGTTVVRAALGSRALIRNDGRRRGRHREAAVGRSRSGEDLVGLAAPAGCASNRAADRGCDGGDGLGEGLKNGARRVFEPGTTIASVPEAGVAVPVGSDNDVGAVVRA